MTNTVTLDVREGEAFPFELCIKQDCVEGNSLNLYGDIEGTYKIELLRKDITKVTYVDRTEAALQECVRFRVTRDRNGIHAVYEFAQPIKYINTPKEEILDKIGNKVEDYNRAMKVLNKF